MHALKILAIFGLDYVGLPLAFEFGKSRPVIGFDIDSPKLKQAQVFIVAVFAASQFGHERGHAALVVLTTEGEWVLDMTGEPARKQDLPYRWVKIQQGARWYSVEN